jgi:hypothetical protein
MLKWRTRPPLKMKSVTCEQNYGSKIESLLESCRVLLSW